MSLTILLSSLLVNYLVEHRRYYVLSKTRSRPVLLVTVWIVALTHQAGNGLLSRPPAPCGIPYSPPRSIPLNSRKKMNVCVSLLFYSFYSGKNLAMGELIINFLGPSPNEHLTRKVNLLLSIDFISSFFIGNRCAWNLLNVFGHCSSEQGIRGNWFSPLVMCLIQLHHFWTWP